MKLIISFIGALMLLATLGCESDEHHGYRGGYYDRDYYGYGHDNWRHSDRDRDWYRDHDRDRDRD